MNIAAALLILLAFPDMSVKWSSPANDAISVAVDRGDPRVEECLSAGLQVRYRYDFQICRRRTGWFSACKDVRSIVSTLEYDPISENYKLVSDRLYDSVEPETTRYLSIAEALGALVSLKGIPLQALGGHNEMSRARKPLSVWAKLDTGCRGEYNQTIARISYFLSLGLVKLSEHSTGWVEYSLNPSASEEP